MSKKKRFHTANYETERSSPIVKNIVFTTYSHKKVNKIAPSSNEAKKNYRLLMELHHIRSTQTLKKCSKHNCCKI